METVFRIKGSELDAGFLAALQSLFGRNKELEISIQPSEDGPMVVKEPKQAYMSRLEKSAQDVANGKVVRFTSEEFQAFSTKLQGQ